MEATGLKLQCNQAAYTNYKFFICARNYKSPKNYITPVMEFLLWIEVHGIKHIDDLTNQDMQNYYGHLTTRPNKRLKGKLSESSVKGHFLALNLLFEMLLNSGEIKRAYVLPAFNNAEKKHRNILTIDEIKELKKNCKNQLELSIINIAYGCGLRRKELENLNVQDVLLTKGYLIVCEGKNSKRREIPIPSKIMKELKKYLIHYRPLLLKDTKHFEDAFFINPKGNRMTGDHLNDTLKYIISHVGNAEIINKKITLHCLRHSIATHLQEAGAGLEFIRDFLGHEEIDTTILYMVRRKRQLILV